MRTERCTALAGSSSRPAGEHVLVPASPASCDDSRRVKGTSLVPSPVAATFGLRGERDVLVGERPETFFHCPHMHLLLQVWVLIFRACSLNLARLPARLAVTCASMWAGSFLSRGVTTTVHGDTQ